VDRKYLYVKDPPAVTFKVHGKRITVHGEMIAVNGLRDEAEKDLAGFFSV
jgi:hypothetical protein